MARLARLVVPHHAHIVSIRALSGLKAFPDARSKQAYTELLHTYCEKHGCTLLAYAVLDDRATMVMVPTTDKGIGKVMQSVGRFYVQHYNQHHERTGTLWDGRYRCAPVGFVESVYQAVYAVESTPVTAGLADAIPHYAFSSHTQNNQGRLDVLIASDACAGDVWPDNAHQTGNTYVAFLRTAHTVDTTALLERAYKGWVVGSDAYAEKVEAISGRRAAPKAKGGDRRSSAYRVSKGLPAKPSILKKVKNKKRAKPVTQPVSTPVQTAVNNDMKKTAVPAMGVTQTMDAPVEYLSEGDVKSLAKDLAKDSAKNAPVPPQQENNAPIQEPTPNIQDSIVQSLADMEVRTAEQTAGQTKEKPEPVQDVDDEPVQGSLF